MTENNQGIGALRHALRLQNVLKTPDGGGGWHTVWQDAALHPLVYAAIETAGGVRNCKITALKKTSPAACVFARARTFTQACGWSMRRRIPDMKLFPCALRRMTAVFCCWRRRCGRFKMPCAATTAQAKWAA